MISGDWELAGIDVVSDGPIITRGIAGGEGEWSLRSTWLAKHGIAAAGSGGIGRGGASVESCWNGNGVRFCFWGTPTISRTGIIATATIEWR